MNTPGRDEIFADGHASSQPLLGPVMLFGSPLIALAIDGAVSVFTLIVMPAGVAPYLALVWIVGGFFAALGSATGGMMCGGKSDDRRSMLGIVGFFGGLAVYAALIVLAVFVQGMYYILFRWV